MKDLKEITSKKLSFKLAAVTTIWIFILLVIMMLTSMLLTIMFYGGTGTLFEGEDTNIGVDFIILVLSITIVGTVLSRQVSKSTIETIVELSNATHKVANGDFNVKLDKHVRTIEIEDMVHNFNIMTEELRSMEMFRSDFIENVSHEFKTPISVIEGYATLLQNENLTQIQRNEYTRLIISNTKRLSTLTGNILLLSKVENQKIVIKKDVFLLDEQIREIILLFEEQWSEKGIDLNIELNEVYFQGNRELLSQVWQNIIGNAIKFVDYGGEIHISLYQKDDLVFVSVIDNGIGMSKEVVDRVFEKFYQGEESRTSTGNGLGLALAKRIIEIHNGEILVNSNVGKGSKFTVVLPIEGDKNSR